LIIDKIPSSLKGLAYSEEKEIMAIKHNFYPVYGIQYHPEAILTEYGKEILKNWIFLHKIPH
jgi:anthranilate/para-aminobenzoate synthase component II